MASFGGGKVGGAGAGSNGEAAGESSGSTPVLSFFRRVKDAVVRPVPGLVKGVINTGSSSAAAAPSSSAARSAGTVRVSTSTERGKATKASAGKVSAGSGSKASSTSSGPTSAADRKPYHTAQFDQLMEAENIDMDQLRKLSWNGIPPEMRPFVWQIMLGYLPTNKNRREQAVERKRKEYVDSIPLYFDKTPDEADIADRTTQEGELLRQILVDLPRTSPNLPFFQQEPIQKMMERILYIWSIRHPASGYVQGMNDLLTPLLLVAMQPYAADRGNALRCDVATIPASSLAEVEADAYWTLTKLLDNIQDHYTFSQPGLQRMVLRLEDLMRRHSPALDTHFQDEGVQYMQFAFRWMNCLLLRELPLRAVLRLWDTYLAEERAGFENFHVYVCAVFLKEHEERLMSMQFQDILMFLQELPTGGWGEEEIEPILSQAFILSTLYSDSSTFS